MNKTIECQCHECGAVFLGEPRKVKEQADADGNRGVWVLWVTCPMCDEDFVIAWDI